ncbi:Uncharacterised protein [Candidatus Burarchaeum australiense]|nr:Uncharacterised protein [Candidatus Burarchaeum australiense]
MAVEELFEYVVKGAGVLIGLALVVLFAMPFAVVVGLKMFAEWLSDKIRYWFLGGREKEEADNKTLDDNALGQLLLEYERLLRKRAELMKIVDRKSNAVQEFAWEINKVKNRDPYDERYERKRGKGAMESYDVRELGTYDEIKALAVELENVSFRLFAIKQELMLYDIDKEGDDDEV